MAEGDHLADRVFAAVRADLMAGKIGPTERLSDYILAERYGVSRTPMREALARLLADGLIERRDRALYPYRPRLHDLDGLYELRTTLELRGIARVQEDPAGTYDRDVLGPELEKWHAFRTSPPRPDAGFVGHDEQFHIQLLAAAGNHILVQALEQVNSRIRPVRMFDYLTEDRMQATIDEHIAIAEAAYDNDLPQARSALTAHIDESRRVAVERASAALSMADIVMALQQ